MATALYPWITVILVIMTVTYIFSPRILIPHKNEYIKFFLLSISVYVTIFLILGWLFSGYVNETLFFLLIVPWLFVSHLIYPFKELKRNRNLSFFLFFLSLIPTGFLFLWLAVSFSSM